VHRVAGDRRADLWIELETMTAMYDGSGPAGGGRCSPGSVDQVVPHATAFGVSAKPLNDAGTATGREVVHLGHWAPQKVTS
jgi:hypothetical protein